MLLFIIFLILEGLCILLPLVLLFAGRARWVKRAALVPLSFALASTIIGVIGHISQFTAWRLVAGLIFAAAITALVCLCTALLLSLFLKRLQPPPAH